MAEEDEKQPIIIKRVKKGGGGHHGGAWKVAYADFVTAMMAFFLLLWLLNVTTDEQKQMISAYFSPADPRVSESVSGSGGVLGGTTMSPDGAMTSTKEPVVGQPGPPSSNTTGTTGDEAGGPSDQKADQEVAEKTDEEILEELLAKREEEAFKAAEDELKQAIESVPELKALAQNLLIDQTPEGLRIQIVDQEGKPMFPLGSADMFDITRKLLQLINEVIKKLPNRISIRGHTDSYSYAPGAKYTNWELSADRANASRRVLLDSGLDPRRIENVIGKADREHLVPDQPTSARNRRISIILLKESIVPGIHEEGKKAPELQKRRLAPTPMPITPKKPVDPEIPVRPKRPPHPGREEGIIYFP